MRHLLLLLIAFSLACTELKPGDDRLAGDVMGQDTPEDMGPGDVTEDVGDSQCPPLSRRPVVVIDSAIDENTSWSCQNNYELVGRVYVVGDVNLTIGFGTHIFGRPLPMNVLEQSALIITSGSRLVTQGTDVDPVVFTSGAEVGMRNRGDWGGVALLGDAPINNGADGPTAGEVGTGSRAFEGLDGTDQRNRYGGNSVDHDCGNIRYTRIEFAGNRISSDKELNGLSLAGCGTGTNVNYLQVHRGFDDGVEMFGGGANMKHIVITGARDDSIDWDQGFNGRMQFVVVQQYLEEGDNGIEADNNGSMEDAEPRSNPTIYNMTLIGANSLDRTGTGMVLREGTWATIRNFIVMNFLGGEAFDIRSVTSGNAVRNGDMTVQNGILFNNRAGNHFDSFETDDDGGLNEVEFFNQASQNLKFNDDPNIPGIANIENPSFVPVHPGPASTGAVAPPNDGFFDTTANFLGALDPNGEDWTEGWTSYPLN